MADPQSPSAPLRVLGFGKHPEVAAGIQAKLRSLGYDAICFAMTDDAAGDEELCKQLQARELDVIAIGSWINGQDAKDFPATPETTAWFNRVLNIIVANANHTAKIVLVMGAKTVVEDINRVLGKSTV